MRWCDAIVSIDIELICKSSKDNLVLNTLGRRKEFIGEKFYDSILLKTIVYCNDSPFMKGINKDYENDEDALEINKVFFQIKTTRK